MSQGLIRFITAGSVDDGKSTLIGRMLFDSKVVLADQILAVSKTKYARVTSSDAAIDLALLTDGLEAEREQGITIDVAYRYFATSKRKFIVADAPGHEQYTRNLVTGASQSDVAVILIDATRVDLTTSPPTLLDQTKRHSAIVKLLGIRHLIFAVNKMDLIGFDETVFKKIETAIVDLKNTLSLGEIQLIPMSALLGDNVVRKSDQMAWYQGPTFIEYLEDLDISRDSNKTGLRLPIQYVARQDGSANADFRGYLGRIESGKIQLGQPVQILPSGYTAKVTEIHIGNDHQQISSEAGSVCATVGQVVSICLDRDVDVSRGDMIVTLENENSNEILQPQLAKNIVADICWLDQDSLSLARKYILRHTTNQVFTKIKGIDTVLDVKTLSHGSHTNQMKMNDIGRVQLTLQKPIVTDTFLANPLTGAFVLIDESTNHTVAAGMIREVLI
jgi:sulfate adenylyltransferase subunit 1